MSGGVLPRWMNALPPVDIALSVRIVPHGYHRAVEAKAKGMGRARRQGDHVSPLPGVALTCSAVSRHENTAGRAAADRMTSSGGKWGHVHHENKRPMVPCEQLSQARLQDDLVDLTAGVRPVSTADPQSAR